MTPKEKAIERLITFTQERLQIRRAYLDRGFFSVGCINTLESLGVKYIIPAIQNRKVKRLVDENPPNTVVDYTMKRYSGKTKEIAVYKLAIVKSIKDPNKKVAFISNIDDLTEENVVETCNAYCKRWGIETAYRMKNVFKVKTTSKNYIVRLFYFLFSVCLYNLWVLASIFLSPIKGVLSKKPLISAKIFGTILSTTTDPGWRLVGVKNTTY